MLAKEKYEVFLCQLQPVASPRDQYMPFGCFAQCVFANKNARQWYDAPPGKEQSPDLRSGYLPRACKRYPIILLPGAQHGNQEV